MATKAQADAWDRLMKSSIKERREWRKQAVAERELHTEFPQLKAEVCQLSGKLDDHITQSAVEREEEKKMRLERQALQDERNKLQDEHNAAIRADLQLVLKNKGSSAALLKVGAGLVTIGTAVASVAKVIPLFKKH